MKISDYRFVFLDTETTTQIHQKTDDENNFPLIIEIAGLKWNYKKEISYTDFKEDFVNPGCKIHPASMAIHHITNEQVKNAPSLKEIEHEWEDWVDSCAIVAYNSDYDRHALKNTSLYQKEWIDAYRIAMHFWSINDLNNDGFPLLSLKQQELRYWLNLPSVTGDAHRAGADIQVTALIVERAIELYLECGFPDDIEYFKKFIQQPIQHKVIPMGSKIFMGKKAEELENWALKKAFNPQDPFYESFKKFDVLSYLYPEYVKRFGEEPNKEKKTEEFKNKSKGFNPERIYKKPPLIDLSQQSESNKKSKWTR